MEVFRSCTPGRSTSYAASTFAGVFGAPLGARACAATAPRRIKNNVGRSAICSDQLSPQLPVRLLRSRPGRGPGTWASVCEYSGPFHPEGSCRAARSSGPAPQGVATALPLRDASVDVVVTDPPYYDMVEYADASDLFHVWLKRMLFDIEPDLFGPDVQQPDGLQDKNQEIIVRRVHEPNRVRHDTEFYETMLANSFSEAKRVLKSDGHLVVVFGHSDPDAWRRLLGALQTAGFVVTSAWPSRTESANTGVASIKVTVTIGCRVAPDVAPARRRRPSRPRSRRCGELNGSASGTPTASPLRTS